MQPAFQGGHERTFSHTDGKTIGIEQRPSGDPRHRDRLAITANNLDIGLIEHATVADTLRQPTSLPERIRVNQNQRTGVRIIGIQHVVGPDRNPLRLLLHEPINHEHRHASDDQPGRYAESTSATPEDFP